MAHLNKFAFGVTAFWLVTAFACYFNFQALETTTHWYVHTYRVLEVNKSIAASVYETQMSQRNYILVGDQQHKQYFEKTRDSIQPLIEKGKVLSADNQSQQLRFTKLQHLLDQRIDKWQYTLDEYERAGLAAAQKAIKTNQSCKIMAELQSVLTEINDEELRLLNIREAANKDSFQDSRLCTFIAFGLSLLVFLIPLASATREHFYPGR